MAWGRPRPRHRARPAAVDFDSFDPDRGVRKAAALSLPALGDDAVANVLRGEAQRGSESAAEALEGIGQVGAMLAPPKW